MSNLITVDYLPFEHERQLIDQLMASKPGYNMVGDLLYIAIQTGLEVLAAQLAQAASPINADNSPTLGGGLKRDPQGCEHRIIFSEGCYLTGYVQFNAAGDVVNAYDDRPGGSSVP